MLVLGRCCTRVRGKWRGVPLLLKRAAQRGLHAKRGGIGVETDSRWSRVMLRHEWEEEDGTDMRAHHVSDSRRGTSWLVERS